MRKILLLLICLLFIISITPISAATLLDPYDYRYSYTTRNVFEVDSNTQYYYQTHLDYNKFSKVYDVSLIDAYDAEHGYIYKHLKETDITNDFSYKTKQIMNQKMPYWLQSDHVVILFDLSSRAIQLLYEWEGDYTNFSPTNGMLYPIANKYYYVDRNSGNETIYSSALIKTIFPNNYVLIALIDNGELLYCYPKENTSSAMARFINVTNGTFDFNTRKYSCNEGYSSYIYPNGAGSSGCVLNTYDINYYVDNVLVKKDSKNHGASYTINYSPTSKTGMDFICWLDEDGNKYTNSSTYSTNKTINLYAHYEKNNYDIYYYIDNELYSTKNYSTKNNASIINNTYQKEYLKFTYWIDSNNNIYYPNDTYSLKKDINLYAHYEPNHFYLNYYEDESLLKQEKYTKGDNVSIIDLSTPKTNYTFKGYKDSSNKYYYPNEQYILNEDLDLYAVYEENYYIVRIPKKIDISNNNTSFKITIEGNKQVNITVSNTFEIKEFNGKKSITGTAYIENNTVYITHNKLTSGYWMANLNINISSQ